jgi:hypothetical protein
MPFRPSCDRFKNDPMRFASGWGLLAARLRIVLNSASLEKAEPGRHPMPYQIDCHVSRV